MRAGKKPSPEKRAGPFFPGEEKEPSFWPKEKRAALTQGKGKSSSAKKKGGKYLLLEGDPCPASGKRKGYFRV